MPASNPPADTSYERSLAVAAAPAAVLAALSTVERIAGWWSPATGDAAPGGQLRLAHRDSQPLVLEVLPAEAHNTVAWRVLDYPLNPEWIGTEIRFTVSEGPSGSVIHLRHAGLVRQLECYDHCSRGWDFFLPSLRDYVQSGSGRPLIAA